VYAVSADNRLHASGALSGKLRWAWGNGDDCLGASSAVAYGLVFIGFSSGCDSDASHLIALDAATGVGAWSWAAVRSAPALGEGLVFSNDTNFGSLLAIDARTGRLVWEGIGGGGGIPAVANGVVHYGRGTFRRRRRPRALALHDRLRRPSRGRERDGLRRLRPQQAVCVRSALARPGAETPRSVI
jgi:outer membrane protein assembly factor BamB